jgi:hypothetical protein
VATVLTAILLAALYFENPSLSRIFPPCPFNWATGLYCPGCGALRAIHFLLHGHLGHAFGMNPLMVVSLPFLGLLALRPRLAFVPAVPWVAATVLLAYGIARNIPALPFELLAPH